MVGQTIQVMPTGEQAGQFEPVPTRIAEVPELIVEPENADVREQILKSLTELGTRLSNVHVTAAEAYLSQGHYADAVPHLEAAVGMDSTNVQNANQLGYTRYLAGDDDGAIATFNGVLAIHPENSDALYNLGMIRFGIDDLAAAETAFRHCVQIDSNNPEVWNNLGVVLFKAGKVADAKAAFHQSLTLDPGNEDATFNLSAM